MNIKLLNTILYCYSNIVQSEQSIYLIQCSDWLFFFLKYEFKLVLKSFMAVSPLHDFNQISIIFHHKKLFIVVYGINYAKPLCQAKTQTASNSNK